MEYKEGKNAGPNLRLVRFIQGMLIILSVILLPACGHPDSSATQRPARVPSVPVPLAPPSGGPAVAELVGTWKRKTLDPSSSNLLALQPDGAFTMTNDYMAWTSPNPNSKVARHEVRTGTWGYDGVRLQLAYAHGHTIQYVLDRQSASAFSLTLTATRIHYDYTRRSREPSAKEVTTSLHSK